jgi:CCR4-NOT transcription complex subunit 1
MAVNPRTLALSYISYLVSNLNKKNYKSSIAELADLVEKYGFDADRHLFRWLLSYVDLSTDGKQSGGKDFHQVQLLIQEAGALITKPYCASVVCYGLESPELKSLRASGLLFQQLSRVLRLTRVQEAVFGIGLLKSSDPELRTEASQFLKNKLPDLLRSYTDIDVGSGQEGGLNDIAIEVLHLLLSHLLQSPSDEVGVHAEQLSAFVTALRRDFPRERVPVVLSPLLYPGDRDIAQDKLLPESAITGPSRMAQLELCDILREMGYHSTSSHDLLSDLIRQVDSEGLTPLCVAKCVGLMVRTHTGLSDQVPLQSLAGPSSPLWEKEKPQELPATATTWMTDIFVDVVKEQAPHLNWQEVMVSLDHPGFVVKDVDGLRVILSVYRRATSDLFPVQILYRVWNNMEGQLSWIKIGVSGVAEFSFGDYIWRAVKVDALKTPPDQENRQIMTWMSLELIETLMLLAESGQYDPVLPLFNYPIKHCPDILMLAILQVKPRWNTLQLELFNQLLPIFLASHQSNANALGVLQFAWNSTHMASIVRPQMLQGMADWYMKGEPFDQARLMRILDLAHELKALSLLLNGTRFQFVIDLAVLAAQREFLKLDKWMTDRIKEHQEAFITACAIYLKQRTSQVDKLPPEIVTSMLTVLQICQIPPSSETAEIIHALLEEYGPVMPRIRPSQLLLQQPPHAKGFDPFVAPGVRVQPGLPINPVAPTVVSSSVTQPAFPPGQQPLTFSGGNVPPEQSKPTPSQTPSTLPPTSGQTTLPAIDPQLLAQRPNLMGGTLPITDSFSSGLLSSLQHSQHTQQAGQPSRLPAQTPTSVRQDAIPGMDHSFVKEIEDEANSYFQKIYNRMMTLDEVLETLKVFKGSTNQKEKDVYLCMLRNLFEEYRFFPHYPEKELRITGSLFGGLIEHSLVTYMFLGTALRYVLEALKKQPGTNMHLFGIAALDKFRSRLKEYPQYCQHVAAIPHFSEFPARLIQCVEYGQQSRDPPIRPAQPLPPPAAPAASVPSITKPVVTATAVQPPKTTVTKPASTSPIEVTATQTQPVPAPKTTGPSIANTTNIDTLLMAVDPMPSFSIPAEDIQEKVGFIFNNMTLQNLPQKSDEVKDLIEDKHWKWLAHYLVLKRVPIEPNYHATYVAFIELHREGEFEGFALLETFRNIKVLLHSSKGDSGFTDRSLLKNLGHWLGLLTLARNIPILQKDIAMKHLLLEAYNKGVQEMLYVVPFVAKALEACAHKSSIFKPPNPWTMAILGVLVEIYKLPNIKVVGLRCGLVGCLWSVVVFGLVEPEV